VSVQKNGPFHKENINNRRYQLRPKRNMICWKQKEVIVMHDQRRDDELRAKIRSLLEITESFGVSITPELAAFGAQFIKEVGIRDLLILNEHPQRNELIEEDWVYLWKEWCAEKEKLEALSSSETHDLAQAVLDGYGIDISLACSKDSDLFGRNIEKDAAVMGLSKAEVIDIYAARARHRDASQNTILVEFNEKAGALHPAHRNWVCGYLRSNYPIIFPTISAEKSCSSEEWQEKIAMIVGTCLAQPAPLNYKILTELLKHSLWLEQVALKSTLPLARKSA
jgi:hypothetical protein